MMSGICWRLDWFFFSLFPLRSQITEEDTASTTTTTILPLPAASSPRFSSTTSSSTPESHTESAIPITTHSSTAASTVTLQASTVHSTHITPTSQTQEPSTRIANSTDVITLQTETSTGTLGVTTSHSNYITTTHSYTHSPPASSTEAVHTTLKEQTDRGTTEQVVTTSPTKILTTKAPSLPSEITLFFDTIVMILDPLSMNFDVFTEINVSVRSEKSNTRWINHISRDLWCEDVAAL